MDDGRLGSYGSGSGFDLDFDFDKSVYLAKLQDGFVLSVPRKPFSFSKPSAPRGPSSTPHSSPGPLSVACHTPLIQHLFD